VAGSSSFFEKKEPKKLLSICRCQRCGTDVANRRHQGEKSFFGSFFSKRELLAFLPLAFAFSGREPKQIPLRQGCRAAAFGYNGGAPVLSEGRAWSVA
jgi:hypothetical protein